jgi:hypothetical protein
MCVVEPMKGDTQGEVSLSVKFNHSWPTMALVGCIEPVLIEFRK